MTLIKIGPLFKNICLNDRYAAARKQRLCYGTLGKESAIKCFKEKARGLNGYTKKHNRMLPSEN